MGFGREKRGVMLVLGQRRVGEVAGRTAGHPGLACPVVRGMTAGKAEPYGWGTGTHKMAAELKSKTGYFWQHRCPCFSPVRLGNVRVNFFHVLMLKMSGGCTFINVMLTQGYCRKFYN